MQNILGVIPRAEQTASYLDFPAKGFITTSIAPDRTLPSQNFSISGFVTAVSLSPKSVEIRSSTGFFSIS